MGWLGPISAVGAMLLLTLTMREAMLLYNSRGLTSYKDLFKTLYHPFDKLYVLFEVFFYIMVLMAVGWRRPSPGRPRPFRSTSA